VPWYRNPADRTPTRPPRSAVLFCHVCVLSIRLPTPPKKEHHLDSLLDCVLLCSDVSFFLIVRVYTGHETRSTHRVDGPEAQCIIAPCSQEPPCRWRLTQCQRNHPYHGCVVSMHRIASHAHLCLPPCHLLRSHPMGDLLLRTPPVCPFVRVCGFRTPRALRASMLAISKWFGVRNKHTTTRRSVACR